MIATVVVTLIMVLWGLAMLLCIWMLARNSRVYKYRTHILDRIGESCVADVRAGKPFQFRFQYFDTVSYNAMMRNPFRRLNTYWDESKFEFNDD